MSTKKLTIREQDKLDMLRAFQKLSPEERYQASEDTLDEVLRQMADTYNISPGKAYERLLANRNQAYRQFRSPK